MHIALLKHTLVQRFVVHFSKQISSQTWGWQIRRMPKRVKNLTKWSILRDNVQNSDKMINHQVLEWLPLKHVTCEKIFPHQSGWEGTRAQNLMTKKALARHDPTISKLAKVAKGVILNREVMEGCLWRFLKFEVFERQIFWVGFDHRFSGFASFSTFPKTNSPILYKENNLTFERIPNYQNMI